MTATRQLTDARWFGSIGIEMWLVDEIRVEVTRGLGAPVTATVRMARQS